MFASLSFGEAQSFHRSIDLSVSVQRSKVITNLTQEGSEEKKHDDDRIFPPKLDTR
ncbi:hypothetical protein WUBG_04346 [Wuchereria bancrofti]|uniref:Uncharacterized protein n=1 Tax=Wuchereria bancrofti TaxID=6293 RepID=J9EQF3_WUCBA|nr:hypothetical protein WUBG_04346 [Wuchereria bancrofti]